ncbi:hypothetical protein J6590_004180 [Homalodisca vitripennis]|nr:hypothetical protein J6590_004180 [Homalodisca vitripennis]
MKNHERIIWHVLKGRESIDWKCTWPSVPASVAPLAIPRTSGEKRKTIPRDSTQIQVQTTLKDPAVFESISGHYATGEKPPVPPLTEIDRHLAGYNLCHELFKAHLDLEIYSTKDFWQDIMKRLWPAHFILPHDHWNSLPCNFSAIVTEQWCAAYFSHVWARMVAADVYTAFTEPDVDLKNIGSRFRDTYLAFGGSCPPGEVFRRFRGRDPSSEAYLKYLGLH